MNVDYEAYAKQDLVLILGSSREVFRFAKQRREYRLESDLAFQKLARKIRDEKRVYFELVNDGCYRLIPFREVI